MAKNMAFIQDSVVANVLWCSDSEPETESLICTEDLPVRIGDAYNDGKFYRDGSEVLAPLEAALKKIEEYEKALETLGVTL